ALEGADFVVTAFQIGGYDPCTITDFEIPKKFGLRQTIADTLGVGGIMRALRTIPHLWSLCEDMTAVCPDATLLQYVNPMSMNMAAIAAKYPDIKAVGLCHSVENTVIALSIDLGIPFEKLHYRSAGINHIAFLLEFGEIMPDGTIRRFPTEESKEQPTCPNTVRYEVMTRLGYFPTESSEHFSEYVSWFIKSGREDLIEKFGIPLDEYPRRCREAISDWEHQFKSIDDNDEINMEKSHEYAATIMESCWTGKAAAIYGNVQNKGMIANLPDEVCVEVPCLLNRNGIQPTAIGKLPAQLAAVMQPAISVQTLVVEAMMTENKQHIYHAALMDSHTAAELDPEQIWQLVDELIEAHGDWLPHWMHAKN
ncbi:UNVERIFIED_CONTAM: hypothetical protein GTU68_002525, partial [Idotea baltica]|nr:hypothetical protein [Idotea baltica]